MTRRLGTVLLLLQMLLLVLLLVLMQLAVSGDMVRHRGDIEAVVVTSLRGRGRHVGHL